MNREQQLIDLGLTEKDGWYNIFMPATTVSSELLSVNGDILNDYSEEEWQERVDEIKTTLSQMNTPFYVKGLIKALQEDEDYRRTWKDNIAMAFKDEHFKQAPWLHNTENGSKFIHEVANNAAENFLNLLCKE